jgi:hypothetical protein
VSEKWIDEDELTAQLAESRELLGRLKLAEPAPKRKLAIALLERARLAAWDARTRGRR